MKKILLPLLLSCLFACEKEGAVSSGDLAPRKDIVLTRSQQDIVRNNRQFAYEFFKLLSEKENGESMIISPLSITFAMGLVGNGALGQTQKSICDVLGFTDGTIEDLNDFCKIMMTESPEVDPSTKIGFANSAIVNKNRMSLKSDFTKTIEFTFAALVSYKDFAKDDVKGFINNWCSEKTSGMITNFIEEPVKDSEMAKFLNATYFKGIWADKFNKSDSKKEKFTCEDGSKVTVNMMHKEFSEKTAIDSYSGHEYGYVDGLFKTTRLDFGNQAFFMDIYLPGEGRTINDVKEWLVNPSHERITWRRGTLDVKLPSFETEYKEDILETLLEMGMTFDDQEFGNMSDKKVPISKVLHAAKIKVDEQGAEAAAVTDVTIKYGGGPIYEDTNFHADHPFVYTISELSTGAIFFIGQYTGK